MSQQMNEFIAIVGLVLSAILSGVGISGLFSTGYTVLGYAMLIVYGLPMITVGSYKIYKNI